MHAVVTSEHTHLTPAEPARTRLAQAGFSLIEAAVVLGVIAVISAIAVPMTANALKDFRLSGDARAVSNAISLAKMRAAATFNPARVFIDTSGGSYRVETWNGTAWTTDSGSNNLNSRVSFGFGSVGSSPQNAPSTVAQPAACLSGNGSGTTIGNTSCVIFNSRGVPVDNTASKSPLNYSVYVTDGTTVYASVVSLTGMIRLWRGQSASSPSWTVQ